MRRYFLFIILLIAINGNSQPNTDTFVVNTRMNIIRIDSTNIDSINEAAGRNVAAKEASDKKRESKRSNWILILSIACAVLALFRLLIIISRR